MPYIDDLYRIFYMYMMISMVIIIIIIKPLFYYYHDMIETLLGPI